VVTFIVDEVAAELGLNDASLPLGRPLTFRVTGPVNPLFGVIVIEYEVPLPGFTLRLGGEAEMEKSGDFTTNVTVVEWTRVPLVPVTLSV
jgi:hypothetical protein